MNQETIIQGCIAATVALLCLTLGSYYFGYGVQQARDNNLKVVSALDHLQATCGTNPVLVHYREASERLLAQAEYMDIPVE